MKKQLKEFLSKQYKKDKIWCIDYHNKGEVEIYNMIFGRLQSYCTVDAHMKLGLGLLEDMEKNVPWNKKLLAGYRNTQVGFEKEDIDNFNKSM